MMLLSILICLCCLLFLLSIYLAWKLYNFSLIIISMEDAIDESLELLDQKYSSMNHKLMEKLTLMAFQFILMILIWWVWILAQSILVIKHIEFCRLLEICTQEWKQIFRLKLPLVFYQFPVKQLQRWNQSQLMFPHFTNIEHI